ncbi:recombinase family protein [Salmonella enterica]|nr:recombinase family protein [Salmonella enterica]
MKVIAYYRVSTRSQGESGLGLEAQRDYIETAIKANGWELLAEFEDKAVSGSMKPEERPAMAQALKMAKQHKAAILAAKTDRFSRDVEDMARLIKQADLKVATMPHADKFQLHLYAVLAEQERDFIRSRTREALAALQARANAGDEEAAARVARRNATASVNRSSEAMQRQNEQRTANAAQFANQIRAHIVEIQHDNGGQLPTLAALAAELNARGIKSRSGTGWNPATVRRVLLRMKPLAPLPAA